MGTLAPSPHYMCCCLFAHPRCFFPTPGTTSPFAFACLPEENASFWQLDGNLYPHLSTMNIQQMDRSLRWGHWRLHSWEEDHLRQSEAGTMFPTLLPEHTSPA